MYQPTLEQVRKLADQGNLIPIFREISADLETPVSAYLKVARAPYSFLLESVEGGERIARFSFIGTEPHKIIKTGPGQEYGAVDPLILIEKELSQYKVVSVPELPRFNGGAVGYLSYETVGYFEKLPSPKKVATDVPESIFMFANTFLVFDHPRHKMLVVSHLELDGDIDSSYADAVNRIEEIVGRLQGPINLPHTEDAVVTQKAAMDSNVTKDQHEAMVERVKEYIVAGDVIQTVVAQRLARPTTAHPFQIYRALRAINPSPYMYYLELDGFQIVGASPEMLVQVENGVVATHPIAGTRPRGANAAEDDALEAELRNDEKEQAEHIMLLDLGRNDIGRVSEPGTVEVTQLMDVERYSHVMHLVSHVTGKLRKDYTSFDALRACFPAGTVSGAPKIRAMEIIAELEPDKRGPYAGAVGYFDFSGNMDTAIAIRTLVVKDGVAYAQAGGGIVYDSVPDTEYRETLHKASAVLRAIDQAELEGSPE
ncbi:MAG: anthranilate synthase component I [SAR202 cluster bacterium Casp-Chloro-G4]|nr:anthranilate synthase component I [Chloroflexota bacterium]MDA1227599.1 anthranilate synthase component I [Chloroflexota bacterium]PKB60994.1 MAG: anthranilate synthase component I [SAR202 cluster bacterium Casp-Chloro-G4]